MVILEPTVLNRVAKPGRYTGQEWNSVRKDPSSVDLTFALAFPDVYEVGMSNLGLKILYHILNQRQDTLAERVYAPWVDMEDEMRRSGMPLYTLETFRPVREIDAFGFTLQYEMSYSNILNMLDLAGIPLLSSQRSEEYPIIIGGGPCAFNAEPLVDFFDCFVLGESEESIEEIADCLIRWKRGRKQGGKPALLRELAGIDGVYVPSFYEVSYHLDGTISWIEPLQPEAKPRIVKRIVKDLDQAPFPTHPVLPYLEIVHDRIMLELFRGCTRGCRFCQAGTIYRPVRERRPKTLRRLAQEIVDSTGYNEMSLISLSSADYSCLRDLVSALQADMSAQQVSVSLPSLRIDSFSVELANQLQKVRKSGLTFAPEAGTQRLRDVINKGVTEENLEEAVRSAFQAGWSSVKLYFMIGLPTETEEDVRGIARLAYRVLDIYKEVKGRRGATVNVSISSFVPKPHTPFQWFGQNSIEMIEEKQALLKSLLKDKNISLHWHDAPVSFMEGVFARGDRKLGRVLMEAWQRGAKYDGWSEHFKYDVWLAAFEAAGVDPHFYANRERQAGEVLPWDHLSTGVDKAFMYREYEKALEEQGTVDCRRGQCGVCGVCPGLGVAVVDWEGANA
ncbi:TIGR03960 family B12-binding radical SAM protein [Acetonema longum]|uniref:Radical SAM family protein n=1 Tax=Acetonema longum DSM 6540 TaxID=1009370 RepID=F7NHP7_9FIRM|nr:TIGR03960 family B12-binding radical SAM protein [Acetonema longum]EGO64422.1 radical SAM family protein [Acetonema longum DSM 6540]